MVEWFLFDRVDAEAGGTAVGGERDVVAGVLADEAEAALAGAEATEARAQVAAEAPVGEGGFEARSLCLRHHVRWVR